MAIIGSPVALSTAIVGAEQILEDFQEAESTHRGDHSFSRLNKVNFTWWHVEIIFKLGTTEVVHFIVEHNTSSLSFDL